MNAEQATQASGSAPGRPIAAKGAAGDVLQFATFHLNDELFGIDILEVQEIQLPQPVTPVPRAPEHVLGLISLRGQIVTLIDLRRRLRMDTEQPVAKPYHVVVRTGHGVACFEVGQIGDVVNVPPEEYRQAPDSVRAVDKRFLEGVYPMSNGVLSVLNVPEVLSGS